MVKENEFSRQIKIENVDRSKEPHSIEADSNERESLAERFEISAVHSLSADVNIKRMGDKVTYHVYGKLSAEVEQESVVSGEAVLSAIAEDFEAWFIDGDVASFEKAQKRRGEEDSHGEIEILDEKDDPERIIGGMIDIGEVVAQFMALALNPYPHNEGEDVGDYIESKEEKPNPFAALASLKSKE